MTITSEQRPRLAIVGGGYLGSDLAKSLEQNMDVTLIERASHFTHAPAMIRAMVEPALLDQVLIPYDGLLKQGRALAGLAETLPGAELDALNRVKVDDWLRPSDLPNVFAAGDIAATGDGMTIVAISRQKPWLEKTLKALASGKSIDTLKPYAPWGEKAPILIPLGPQRGSAFLMAFTGGDWITRMMKGRDLFISKYRKLLGQT